jgi:dTMP kinase
VLLYSASRAQHVDEVIRPAIEAGDVVVCDRYATSTLAYQGYGSGMDRDLLTRIQDWATGGLKPDLVVLLDVSVETGLARRAAGSAAELTRWEDESRHDRAFHQRVREGYLEMAAADPGRWVVLDGSGEVEAVAEEVSRAVDAVLLQADIRDAAG